MRFAAAALVLSGCVTAPVAPPTGPVTRPIPKEERDAAMVAYMNCLAGRVPSIDDGISDANTIARAMRGACPDEFEVVANIHTVDLTPAQRRMFRARDAEVQDSWALNAVLKVRAAKRR